MKGLTPKQKQILDFIAEFSLRNGYAPSQQEIAKFFQFSSLGTVQNYLIRLQRIGALQKQWNARRGAFITRSAASHLRRTREFERLDLSRKTPQPQIAAPNNVTPIRQTNNQVSSRAVPVPSFIEVPLLGLVAAGAPIEAIETTGSQRESVSVPAGMIRAKAGSTTFALKVQGDSMIEDGIMDGDYVIIRKQSTAQNGDTVVALINNEATIKRFHRMRDHIELRPANSKYKPIVVRSKDESCDFKIEGILSGVLRMYK